jgi:tetratricopeptide (TPR) repeat protein
MSNAAEVEAGKNNVCANCGVAEVDDTQLEDCGGCDLVKYCSEKCTENHREQHEEECQKRVQELHDKKLFRQSDGSHRGECPLCFLPLPLDPKKSTFYSCCSKTICDGCEYAHYMSDGGDNCPFCREPAPEEDDEHRKRMMKRVKANDPAAISEIGTKLYREGDWDSAFEYYMKAAELGEVVAHNQLGWMYWKGEVVEKDEEKAVYHLEKAAIGGHPQARHNLAFIEQKNGHVQRAVKHLIIAAKLGRELSMKALWKHYSEGNITKEDLEATLRNHQAALDEMKSPEREVAEAWRERERGAGRRN